MHYNNMGIYGVQNMANMNEFLLQYYMQRRFNNMPAEVRAQFDVYLASDDFRGNMKNWKSKLMHQDANGKWVNNDMPDPTDANGNWFMDDNEWTKFFNAFQDAFREMSASKDKFKENAKATSFLNEYFGDPVTHLFSNAVATPTAETLINGDFKNFLTTYKNGLEINLKQWGLIDNDFKYSDLISGIDSKKYNTSPDFQKRIKTIAQYITYYAQQPDFQQSLNLQGQQIPNFTAIENGFDTGTVNPNKLDYFKRNYKSLLNTLVTESKVYDVFKLYDKGKISNQIETANGKIDYANSDSKDYVPPKRSDELTPWQHLKDNIKDTWTDYMDKYIKFRGDRLFFSNSAQLIFKALTGAKFKPTDGLAKLVDSAGDIKKNLMYKSPRAVDHFDWLNKTLGELKNTMPKAFAGALKTGGQMRALVSELVIKAVRENKMDEAKTAMEVLSVIKYGYITSKIMDVLGNEKLSIFSDGGLSWNKNQAVQFVTNAMDKSIKAAFMAVGYLITIGGNVIRLNGSKFNGKTGRIKNARDTWIADTAAQKVATQQQKASNETQKTDLENDLTAMRNRGITEQALDASIGQYRQDISTLNQNLDTQVNNLIQWVQANQTHPDAQSVATYLMQMRAGQNPTPPTVTDPAIQTQMQAVVNSQHDITVKTKQMNRKINKRQEFENATQTIQMLSDQITKQTNTLNNWDSNHQDKYRELMAYWDMLESGRDSHTGKMYSWTFGSAKDKQKKFTTKDPNTGMSVADQIILDRLNNYRVT